MSDDGEILLGREPVAKPNDFGAVEFTDQSAAPADHVVVCRRAPRAFVVRLSGPEARFAEDPRLHQQRQRAVDRRFAHAVAAFLQGVEQLLGLEMLAEAQCRFEDEAPWLGVLDPPGAKKAFEGLASGRQLLRLDRLVSQVRGVPRARQARPLDLRARKVVSSGRACARVE